MALMRPHKNMPEVLHYLWQDWAVRQNGSENSVGALLAAPRHLDNAWGAASSAPTENAFRALPGFYELPHPVKTALLRLSPRPNARHPRTATSGVRFARRACG